MKTKLLKIKNLKNSRGYTLLEYCAGAAVIAGVIYVALAALGDNLVNLLNALGTWASERASDIQPPTP